jgi:hypothetical protein
MVLHGPKLHQTARRKQGFSCPENGLESIKRVAFRAIINLTIAESLTGTGNF